jgi:uncharacterized protein YeaO (DUF488 family)
MKRIALKRVYDASSPEDGVRVLVDRLWPRGLKKETAGIDHWLKDIAPSTELRRWFGHDPDRWAEFKKRYRAELKKNPESLAALHDLLKGQGRLTLLFAAKDAEHDNAVALKAFLEE